MCNSYDISIAVSKSTLSHFCRNLDSSFICYWTRNPQTYHGNWIVYVSHNWCDIAMTLLLSKYTLSLPLGIWTISSICWTRDSRTNHGNWIHPPHPHSLIPVEIWTLHSFATGRGTHGHITGIAYFITGVL